MEQQSQVQTQSFSKNLLISTVLVVGGLLIGGLVGYFLGAAQGYKEVYQQNNQVIQPTSTPLNTQIPQPTFAANLGTDWATLPSKYCGVKFFLPPKKEPYLHDLNIDTKAKITKYPEYADYYLSDQRTAEQKEEDTQYWQIREGRVNIDGYSPGGTIFDYWTSAMFVAPIEASGGIAGAVYVACSPNTGSYDAKTLSETFAKNAGFSIKNTRSATMWGKTVAIVNLEGSDESIGVGYSSSQDNYFVVTNRYIYFIEGPIYLNQFIKQTAQKILDNLQFTD